MNLRKRKTSEIPNPDCSKRERLTTMNRRKRKTSENLDDDSKQKKVAVNQSATRQTTCRNTVGDSERLEKVAMNQRKRIRLKTCGSTSASSASTRKEKEETAAPAATCTKIPRMRKGMKTCGTINKKDPSWSNLPGDLLGLILQKLSVVDHIRCGAVCTSWHSAAMEEKRACCNTTTTSHESSHIPWLLLPGFYGPTKESRRFYNIATTQTYWIHLPELRHSKVIGSSDDGWLMAVDIRNANIHAINPITRAHVHFPPTSTFPGLEAIFGDSSRTEEEEIEISGYRLGFRRGEVCAPEWLVNMYMVKAIMFRDSRGVRTAVVALRRSSTMAIARCGDVSWTALEIMPPPAPDNINGSIRRQYLLIIEDIVLHNGVVYAVSHEGWVASFDLRAQPLPPNNSIQGSTPITTRLDQNGSFPKAWQRFLVSLASPEGTRDLLQVCSAQVSFKDEPLSYRIYKLEEQDSSSSSNTTRHWVELESLPNQATLFAVGHPNEPWGMGPSIFHQNCTAGNIPKMIKENSIVMWCGESLVVHNLRDFSTRIIRNKHYSNRRIQSIPSLTAERGTIWINPTFL